jgi:hypothetical protein
LRQPAQDIFLGLEGFLRPGARLLAEDGSVGGGQLPGGDHLVEQMDGGASAVFVSFIFICHL